MSINRASLTTVFCVALMVGGCAWLEASEGAVEEALKVAEAWLDLVDHGEYDQSWQEAAEYFRTAVKRDQWQQAMEGGRAPMGEVVSRELMEANYRSHLAGAPDGDYVVIRFKTSFSNKVESVETITPMLDPDGRWRVSGYYIK